VTTALAGCGAKPKPKATPAPATATSPAEPGAGGPLTEPEPRPVERTRGGVELGTALDGAGDARDEVLAAAKELAKDRAAAVAKLLAHKERAKATVVALLGSQNLDELIGAMLVLQAAGDPTGARAESQDAVLGLLDHEVLAVRDVAWETAAKIADGAALAGLLPHLVPERKLAVVRLLAAWDGEPVREALWSAITSPDAELAIEAALAASAPGKSSDEALEKRLKDLAAGSDAELRLALVMYRRLAAADAKAPLPSKAAVDRALASKDEPLVLEAIRSTLAFQPEDRTPLYEQLAQDPRAAVRAVTSEMLARHTPADAKVLVDKLLGDPEGEVRMAAVSARARIGPPAERVAALLPKLSDSHRGVRLAAAVSLAGPDLVALALDALVKQIEREDSDGRKSILGALASAPGRLGPSAVIDLIPSADKKLAVAAHFAISTASGQDFGDDVGAWKGWLDKRYPPPPPAPPAPEKKP
jgi:hypothetical protein